MGYHLTAEEKVSEGVRRCARERLDRAITALQLGSEDDPADAIHTARKSLKQQRALLRLSRAALPRRVRRAENRALAQIARSLSPARDAGVTARLFDELAEEEGSLGPAARISLRQMLTTRAGGATAGPAAAPAVQALQPARERVDRWPLQRDGWRALEPGLERTIRRGRRAFARAQAKPSMANLHAWRKRVKDLWYDLRLLGEVGGPAVRGQAEEASRLSDLLGDEHDLAVLREALGAPALSGPEVTRILELIETRRQRLRAEAFVVGRRLYAEKPKAFRRRLRRSWQAGRRLSELSRRQVPDAQASGTGPHPGGRSPVRPRRQQGVEAGSQARRIPRRPPDPDAVAKAIRDA